MSTKTSIPTLRFDPPRSGWLGLTVSFAGQKILVNTSSAFDPYPDFLKWLENLVTGALPCTWRINEAGSYMLFTVYPAEAGKGRLVLSGTRERDGTPDDIHDIAEFIDTLVEPQELARSFFQAFRRYLKKGFVSTGWSSYLRQMDFSRLDALLGD